MELLCPAGNYQAAIAALNAGGDAIYIGGKSFSARMSADNFTDEEMINIIQYAHMKDSKVYVTMNTLLYQDEFMSAVKYARFLHKNNVDALIIQDIGLAYYLHKVFPNLELHASTQINCHNLKQAKALKEIGFSRVVLARESNLSLAKEIKEIGLEVEVFVHGALCVSYSGNCLMSSFIGDRSGNRGRCAQPCRMKYILEDEYGREHAYDYLLSTKDLCTLDKVDDLVKSNIDSLKIEGRLKQDEYVYLVTKAYRNAIDSSLKNLMNDQLNNDLSSLKKVFSRTFTKGFIFNESPFNLLNQNSSSHQGERIGKIVDIKKDRVYIKLEKNVHRLDGIRFNEAKQFGRQIQKMFVDNKPLDEAKTNQIIEVRNIDVKLFKGCEVIRTSDYNLLNKVDEMMKKTSKILINGRIFAYKNKPLTFEITYKKIKVSLRGDIVLEALNNGTSSKKIIEQFSKTDKYPFQFNEIIFKGDEDIYIPFSLINKLRNETLILFVERLTLNNNDFIEKEYVNLDYKNNQKDIRICSVLSNRNNQFDLSKFKIDNYDLRSGKRYLNRIDGFDDDVKDGIVHSFIKNDNLIASPYCNITNSYTLDAFYSMGYKECILSLELDKNSIKDLINDFYNRHHSFPNVGLFVYGRMDMMIIKSCVIGTVFKSDKLGCSLCMKNQFYLKDRIGARFPLISDENCITRVLDYKILNLTNSTNELKLLHVNNFYLNFTIEKEGEVIKIIDNILKNKPLNYDALSHSKGHYVRRSL